MGGGLAASYLFDACQTRIEAKKKQEWMVEVRRNSAEVTTSFVQLRAWLYNDGLVCCIKDDQSGLRPLAGRIVERLTERRGHLPTLAVVGELGCGKSSLLRFVSEGLSARVNGVEMVEFSAWGYDSPGAVASGILATLVNTKKSRRISACLSAEITAHLLDVRLVAVRGSLQYR